MTGGWFIDDNLSKRFFNVTGLFHLVSILNKLEMQITFLRGSLGLTAMEQVGSLLAHVPKPFFINFAGSVSEKKIRIEVVKVSLVT